MNSAVIIGKIGRRLANCGITTYVQDGNTISISGATSLCAGGLSTTLTGTPSGGSWTSSDPTIASIDSVTGVLTTHSLGGTVNISYVTTGGVANLFFTVYSKPEPVALSSDPLMCIVDTATSNIGDEYEIWSGDRNINTSSLYTSASGTGSGLSLPYNWSGYNGAFAWFYVTNSNGCYTLLDNSLLIDCN